MMKGEINGKILSLHFSLVEVEVTSSIKNDKYDMRFLCFFSMHPIDIEGFPLLAHAFFFLSRTNKSQTQISHKH